jgi:hypothetical protein
VRAVLLSVLVALPLSLILAATRSVARAFWLFVFQFILWFAIVGVTEARARSRR